MLTLLKRLIVQNTSPSSIVIFVRDTILLLNALPLWRYEEFGFMVPIFEHPESFQQPTSLSQVGSSYPASGGHAGGKISTSVGHAERK